MKKLLPFIALSELVSDSDLLIGLGKNSTPIRKDKKPGRNEMCPCGSGLKYKKCCLK